MTVYALTQITIDDRRRYERFALRCVGLLAGIGGRLLAADTSPEALSGEWPHDELVQLEFADRALLDRWARSPEYLETSTDRVAATTGSVLLVAGVAPRARPCIRVASSPLSLLR